MMCLMKLGQIELDVVERKAGALNASSQKHINHSRTPPRLFMCKDVERQKEGREEAPLCGLVKVRPGEKFTMP